MKHKHDQTTVCGFEIRQHDVLEVELETSKSRRRFVHFLVYVEMISEIRSTKSDPKITLEVVKYLSVHDFLDPALGKNPQNYRHIDSISEEGRGFLLVPDEVDTDMAEISVGDIKNVITRHGQLSRAPHLVSGLPIAGFWCRWVLQVDQHVREHIYPLRNTNKAAHPPKPTCPPSLATGDFFCGAGGFSEGFNKAKFDVVVGVDKNMHAYNTWKINHPQADVHFATVETFLSELNRTNITCPDLTVALLSPPCQGFSAANPGGKDDNVNRKALSISTRILTATNAYYGLIENVPGLSFPLHLHHLHEVMINCMKAGYQSRWAILNVKEYGVPTIRKRLFLVVAKLGLTMPAFPKSTISETGPVTLRDAIEDLDISNPREDANSGNPVFMWTREMLTPYAVSMNASDKIEHHAISTASIAGWPVAKWDEPACTIRTSCSNRWACVHPGGERLLSPRECARIMSFPDTYFISGSVTDQYRQIGNAVAPKMAQALGEAFMEAILADFPSLDTAKRPRQAASRIGAGSSTILGKHSREDENSKNGMGHKRCRK
ncbi:S-adenosyl-L-methionine-dependent methyltransferase [Desarmillaria tabescens]|uniref:DNA (cytosine-5-)-methyltransferase n=1 Tax=Armillaria tabescens TaxID=1929756 RepID=A0AA39J2M4_ARMTA|nr:S-adenosyl-L-methionine-dependent methyltransferase [Desarmillaria tabescens]KAK0433303.1 S-adenosyl-L-methionine-dependent methyltransferase [Desarmillaria tabescens]